VVECWTRARFCVCLIEFCGHILGYSGFICWNRFNCMRKDLWPMLYCLSGELMCSRLVTRERRRWCWGEAADNDINYSHWVCLSVSERFVRELKEERRRERIRNPTLILFCSWTIEGKTTPEAYTTLSWSCKEFFELLAKHGWWWQRSGIPAS